MGRFIGMDIHRDFAQVAIVEDGFVTDVGRVDCPRVPQLVGTQVWRFERSAW